MDYIKTTKENIKTEENNIINYQKSLDLLPNGTLVLRMYKGHQKYYHTVREKTNKGYVAKERLINNDTHLIDKLVYADYLREQIFTAKHNIALLNDLLKKSLSSNTEDIIKQLSKASQERIQTNKSINFDYMKQWEHEAYEKLTEFPDGLKHMTTKGYCVRSKSEAIIVNMLHAYGIPFRYEMRMSFNDDEGYPLYPDIVIQLPDGSLIIWEHLGLMNEYNYVKRQIKKIQAYYQNGFCYGHNLIITSDDGNGNLNTLDIKNIIETILIPLFRNTPIAPFPA